MLSFAATRLDVSSFEVGNEVDVVSDEDEAIDDNEANGHAVIRRWYVCASDSMSAIDPFG